MPQSPTVYIYIYVYLSICQIKRWLKAWSFQMIWFIFNSNHHPLESQTVAALMALVWCTVHLAALLTLRHSYEIVLSNGNPLIAELRYSVSRTMLTYDLIDINRTEYWRSAQRNHTQLSVQHIFIWMRERERKKTNILKMQTKVIEFKSNQIINFPNNY